VDRIVAAYDSLLVPKGADSKVMEEVSDALEELQSTVATLAKGIQEKLQETADMEGETSTSSSETEAKERLAKLMDLVSQLEFGQYVRVVFDELLVFIDEKEKKEGEHPGDSLIAFVQRNQEKHKRLEELPRYGCAPLHDMAAPEPLSLDLSVSCVSRSYHRCEEEWKSLELEAISSLDKEVDGFISPLMRSFQSGGELHSEAVRLMQAINQEQRKLQLVVSAGGRFDIFEASEWRGGKTCISFIPSPTVSCSHLLCLCVYFQTGHSSSTRRYPRVCSATLPRTTLGTGSSGRRPTARGL